MTTGTHLDAPPVNHNIAVTDNDFSDPGGPAVFAQSIAGLIISGNRIARVPGPALHLRNVRSVSVARNMCAPPAPIVAPAADRGEVALDANTGLMFQAS
jgi:hypothetical protein